jgi:hypothetical protein
MLGSVLLIITVTFKVVWQPAAKLESLALCDLRIYGEQLINTTLNCKETLVDPGWMYGFKRPREI